MRFLNSSVLARSSSLLRLDNLLYSSLILFTIGCIALISRSDLLPKSLLKNFNIIYFVSLLATQILIQFTFLRQFDSGRANLAIQIDKQQFSKLFFTIARANVECEL